MNNTEYKTFLEEYKRALQDTSKEKDAIKVAASKTKIAEENSNRLFVYVGSYKVEKFVTGAKEIPTYDGDPKAKYKRYIDVETETRYNINMDEVEAFESNPENNIIYREVKMINYLLLHQNFLDVKQQFFEGILSEPQDKVVKKLVNTSEK